MSLRDYLWLALAGALALAAWRLHADGYDSGVAHERTIAAEQATRDAADAQKHTVAGDAGAKAATDKGNAQVADNRQATHETVRTITQIVHDKPSPVQCVADPASLHALQSAASAANRTASELQRASTR